MASLPIGGNVSVRSRPVLPIYSKGGILVEDSRPGYYAVIPADVRYDDRIPANAKLLYGEISALIGASGFCYASNSYFMRVYGFSDPTITRLITKLEEVGYIKRVLEKDGSGKVVRRKIYLSVSIPEIQPPINFDTTSHQNCGEGGIKNDGENNLSNTVYVKESKKEKQKGARAEPLTDEQLHELFKNWITGIADADWTRQAKNELYFALDGFYAPRPKKKQEPARSAAGFTALSNRLLRYGSADGRKSPTLMIDMLERATTAGWKSVFPLNGQSTTEQDSSEGKEEEVWLN